MPVDLSAGDFPWMVVGVSYHASGCKCWSLSWMVVGVSYHANGCKCWSLSRMVVGVSYHADDIRIVDEYLHGGYSYNQHEKGLAL